MLCYVTIQQITSGNFYVDFSLLYISHFEYVFVWLIFLYRPNFSFCIIIGNVINFYMENKLFVKQVTYVQSLFSFREPG